ncbi:hypothetical protein [Scytonema millei]|uniref:Lipoprotein n=1 Tax=Scytonema millei VB511283 TaxID=1245923 RepID=A0A9X5E514_9CYAN|nr:hypothetical protein [Scytonema millei]NHC35063.1 hypothetical protein [Scytonema millei VB511283]
MSNSWYRLMVVGGAIAIALSGCSNLTIDQYEATAKTIYTWQVKYAIDLNNKSPRFETFASTSLINRNGIKPIGAVTGPDDRGLWWAALPPRPTVDEVEQRKKSGEGASPPELIKSVEYQFSYPQGDRQVTLPTNYQVYRQVVKARPTRTPLKLTLGVTDKSVEKAEPVKQ